MSDPHGQGKGGILIDLDFNDAEFVVRKHPDGMYTIDVVEDRLLVNEEQFKQIANAFTRLSVEKGWTLTFKGIPTGLEKPVEIPDMVAHSMDRIMGVKGK